MYICVGRVSGVFFCGLEGRLLFVGWCLWGGRLIGRCLFVVGRKSGGYVFVGKVSGGCLFVGRLLIIPLKRQDSRSEPEKSWV